jgi:hypothetical protein
MTEAFLHYIWKYRLYDSKKYQLPNGSAIEIVNVGEQNFNAGPDFTNVQIKIGDTLWVGNCEIHINASDWYKHNHHTNKAYNNVVLQVVHNNDVQVTLPNGEAIPTIVLSYPNYFAENYNNLINNSQWIACANYIATIDHFTVSQWLTKLCIERLEERTLEIEQILELNKNNWEETFYQFLAKHFGFKVNALPFEMLARSLPLTYLAKHKTNLLQVEALLYGQAGMLESVNSSDDYYLSLQKEYNFLNKKFELKPIDSHVWKFMRLRPANFPTIRIAQFAALIHQSSALFSKLLEINTPVEIEELLSVSASVYWETHYRFEKKSRLKVKSLSPESIHLLTINAIVPLLFVYWKKKNSIEQQEKAISILEHISAEHNSIIEKWVKLGIAPKNAFESQALLQLKNKYCASKKCINCMIGNKLINKKNEA